MYTSSGITGENLSTTFGNALALTQICAPSMKGVFARQVTLMKKIAVLTSGGDAPGMNAAIRAVVRTAVFHDMEVVGVFQGYQGLIDGDFKRLHVRSVAKILGRGGTILKSARCEDFTIPKGASVPTSISWKPGWMAWWSLAEMAPSLGPVGRETGFPVGLPGTIDNDLSGSDSTIGFDTAINTVIDAVDKTDTADSHNRLFFVEVMGRDSGFIALKSGIATGAVAVMTPEMNMSIEDLVAVLQAGEQSNKMSSIVIVAEGDPNGGVHEIAKGVKAKNLKVRDENHGARSLAARRKPVVLDRVLVYVSAWQQ